METFRRERERSQLDRDPHCAKCDWDKEAKSTSGNNISRYFQATARGLFNRESLAVLSSLVARTSPSEPVVHPGQADALAA